MTQIHRESEQLDKSEIQIPGHVLDRWQGVVNTMAKLLGVTAGVVTRVFPPEIEVVSSSDNPGNPYPAGARVNWADHYCEYVISSGRLLEVTDALLDPEWDANPDLSLGLVSYLGLPIHWPDGEAFGTICVLDTKGREYTPLQKELMDQFRGVVEAHLELILQQCRLEEEAREREMMIGRLREALVEIETLSDLIPVCVRCKSVRDDSGYWHRVEAYISGRTDPGISLGLCPDCSRAMIGNKGQTPENDF